jgi:hypothetical protein
MLAAALWMVQNPDWYIELLQNLQDGVMAAIWRFRRSCVDRWRSQWEPQAVPPERLRNDR